MPLDGFGFGLGLQGAPREYVSVYMQRKQQEAQAKQQAEAERRRQKELDDQYLDKFLITGDVDPKLQGELTRASSEAMDKAMKNMQALPLTHRNPNNRILMDLLAKKQELEGVSKDNFQKVRAIYSEGKAFAPPNLGTWLDNKDGSDFTKDLTGLEKVYGVDIDPDKKTISWNPTEKIDIGNVNKQEIYGQQGAFKTDGTTFKLSGVDHYREKLDIPFAKAKYNELMLTSPEYAKNIELSYLQYRMSKPDFNPNDVVGPDGEMSSEFAAKAYAWGESKVIASGQQLETIQALPKGGDTIINNYPGNAGLTNPDKMFTPGSNTPTTYTVMVDGKPVNLTWAGPTVAFNPVTGRFTKAGDIVTLNGNKRMEGQGSADIEMGELGIRRVYKNNSKIRKLDEKGNPVKDAQGNDVYVDTLGGTAVSDDDAADPKWNNADAVEWQVVVMGNSVKNGKRGEPIFVPLDKVENLIIQGMKDEKKRLGQQWTTSDQEQAVNTFKYWRTDAQQRNEALPGYKGTTTQPESFKIDGIDYSMEELREMFPGQSDEKIRKAVAKK